MTSSLDKLKLRAQLCELPYDQLEMLLYRTEWRRTARPEQLPPKGNWNTWSIIAGRGFGKTRTGAEDCVWYEQRHPGHLYAVIAPTHDLLQKVNFEGESGILSRMPPSSILNYNKSDMTLTLKNGAQIQGFSAQDPERLRGPQWHRVWCDEFAAWDYPQRALDNIRFALRLGRKPRMLITTTPKPIKPIRTIITDTMTHVTRGSTYDNKKNLPDSFFDEITKYEGTDIGRQEIHGEVLDFEEAGILKRSWFRLWPANRDFPRIYYVLQSYDTAYKKGVENDPTACTTWGIFRPDDNSPFNLMLLDGWSEKMEYPELRKKAATDYHNTYGPKDSPVDVVLIEDKSSGQSLIQDLNRAGVPVVPYNPGRADKLMRTHAISHLVKQGFIWLPESAKLPGTVRKWAEPFLQQVCQFGPMTFEEEGEEDDYVDTFTQALAWLRDSDWLRMPKDPVYENDEEPKPKYNPYAA